MRISKRQLRRIIKEEKARLLSENRNEAFVILDELRAMGIPDETLLDYLVGNWMPGHDAYQAMVDFQENEI